MPPVIPQDRFIPITEAQGKGMRLERFTARFAILLTAGAAGIPQSTALFNIVDAENVTPAAGAPYQNTKGVFRNSEVSAYNYVNLQNFAVRMDYSATFQNQADLNNLGNCEIRVDRQSEQRMLEFPVHKAWAHGETFQANTTLAASTGVFFFPTGYGYDATANGTFTENVKVNVPTVGDAIAGFYAPGYWLPPGPITISLIQQRGIANLVANTTLEFQIAGFRLVTNVA